MPTLAEAIFQKFEDVNTDVDTSGGIVLIAPKLNVNQHIPKVLVISSSSVDKAGCTKELSKVLANVEELDISHNKIHNLQEIGEIFQNAPRLKFLNLGFNRLSPPNIPKLGNFPVSDTLSSLILVGTEAPWAVIWFLIRHTKNVIELHLSLNKYSQVELPETFNECDSDSTSNLVQKLMFDRNPVSDWNQISKLGIAFPNLIHLSLTDTSIDFIPKDGGDEFKTLQTLWISNSQLSKLEHFENLKHFPALVDLRANGIPFLEQFNEEARRQHFIALLPNIATLNRGRTIGDEDRVNAERNFIRHYMDHPNPPSRYHELKEKHGDVPKLVDVNFKPPTKAKLLIFYEDKEVCRLDVNLKKTVRELKDSLEPIIGLHASKMDLFYLDPFDGHIEKEIMKFPNKQLYTYKMKTDDEIHAYKKGSVVCTYSRFCS